MVQNIIMPSHAYNTIQSKEFHFVSRCGKFFNGESHWVYWCTCNKKKSEFIDSLSSCCDVSYADVSGLLLDCMHIAAVLSVVASFDAVQSISADSDSSGNFSYIIHLIIMNCILLLSDHTYSAATYYAETMPMEESSSPAAAMQASICAELHVVS